MTDINNTVQLLTTAPGVASHGHHKQVPSGRAIRRSQERKQKQTATKAQSKGFGNG